MVHHLRISLPPQFMGHHYPGSKPPDINNIDQSLNLQATTNTARLSRSWHLQNPCNVDSMCRHVDHAKEHVSSLYTTLGPCAQSQTSVSIHEEITIEPWCNIYSAILTLHNMILFVSSQHPQNLPACGQRHMLFKLCCGVIHVLCVKIFFIVLEVNAYKSIYRH